MVKAKLAPKAWAERSRLPRLTAFETPSMPMAKKPRGRLLAGISRRVYAISGGLAGQASEGKETAMRVAQFSEFGGPEKLRIEEVPDPTPAEGEVVIRVAAVGLNFFDTLQLRNRYQVTPTLPHSPGGEVAGTIEALGPGVSRLRAGAKGAWPRSAAMAAARR